MPCTTKTSQKKYSKKIERQVPKFFWFTILSTKDPKSIAKYQVAYLQSQVYKTGPTNRWGVIAFKKYRLVPFDDRLYLFKSRTHIYFVDDQQYCGWSKYALKGAHVFDVPGDQKTMFQFPHVEAFACILQDALDKC